MSQNVEINVRANVQGKDDAKQLASNLSAVTPLAKDAQAAIADLSNATKKLGTDTGLDAFDKHFESLGLKTRNAKDEAEEYAAQLRELESIAAKGIVPNFGKTALPVSDSDKERLNALAQSWRIITSEEERAAKAGVDGLERIDAEERRVLATAGLTAEQEDRIRAAFQKRRDSFNLDKQNTDEERLNSLLVKQLSTIERLNAEEAKWQAQLGHGAGNANAGNRITAHFDQLRKDAEQSQSASASRGGSSLIQNAVFAAQAPAFAAGNALAEFAAALGPVGIAVGVTAAVVGVLAKQMYDLVAHEAAAARELENFASRLGFTVNQASQLSAEAKLAGVSIETLQGAARYLSQALEDPAGSGAKTAKAMHDMGIAMYDAAGQERELGQVTVDVIDQLSKYPTAAERAFHAAQLLGRAGSKELLPLIERHQELQKVASELGYANVDQLTHTLADANDDIQKMSLSWDLFKKNLASSIAPIVIPVVRQITDALAPDPDKPVLGPNGRPLVLGGHGENAHEQSAPGFSRVKDFVSDFDTENRSKSLADQYFKKHSNDVDVLESQLQEAKKNQKEQESVLANPKGVDASAIKTATEKAEQYRTDVKNLEQKIKEAREAQTDVHKELDKLLRDSAAKVQHFGEDDPFATAKAQIADLHEKFDQHGKAAKRIVDEIGENLRKVASLEHTAKDEVKTFRNDQTDTGARIADKQRSFSAEQRIAQIEHASGETFSDVDTAHTRQLDLAKQILDARLTDLSALKSTTNQELRVSEEKKIQREYAQQVADADSQRLIAITEIAKREHDATVATQQGVTALRNQSTIDDRARQLDFNSRLAVLRNNGQETAGTIQSSLGNTLEINRLNYSEQRRQIEEKTRQEIADGLNATIAQEQQTLRLAELEKQVHDEDASARLQAAERLLALQKQATDQAKEQAAQLYQAIKAGDPSKFFQQQFDKIGENAFSAAVGPIFQRLGKQTTSVLGPTLNKIGLGDLFKGTIFDDPQKASKDNTQALKDLTAVLQGKTPVSQTPGLPTAQNDPLAAIIAHGVDKLKQFLHLPVTQPAGLSVPSNVSFPQIPAASGNDPSHTAPSAKTDDVLTRDPSGLILRTPTPPETNDQSPTAAPPIVGLQPSELHRILTTAENADAIPDTSAKTGTEEASDILGGSDFVGLKPSELHRILGAAEGADTETEAPERLGHHFEDVKALLARLEPPLRAQETPSASPHGFPVLGEVAASDPSSLFGLFRDTLKSAVDAVNPIPAAKHYLYDVPAEEATKAVDAGVKGNHLDAAGHALKAIPGVGLINDELQSQYQLGQRAEKEFKEGKYLDAIGHEITGAVPVIGPQSAHLSDELLSGDPHRIAGAVGEFGGTAALGSLPIHKIPGAIAKTTEAAKSLTDHPVIQSLADETGSIGPDSGLKKPAAVNLESDNAAPSVSGFQFHSPNERENLPFAEAVRNLDSPEHKHFVDFSRHIDRTLGIESDPLSALGIWSDGNENSIFNRITRAPDWETIQYSAAIKGDLTNQKGVIPFMKDANGPDSLYQAHVPNASIEQVRDSLNKHGLEYQTLIPTKSGVHAAVFDEGNKLSDSIEAFADEHDIPYDILNGRGRYLGGDTRDEGHAAYREFIAQHETQTGQKHYEGLQRRWADLNERRRAATKEEPSQNVKNAEDIVRNVDPEKESILYHSGTADEDQSIRDNWLEPQVGDWVKQVISSATDDEDFGNELAEKAKLVYLSDKPDWVAGKVSQKIGKHQNDLSLDDIRQHGQLSIVKASKDDPIVRRVKDDDSDHVTNLRGEKQHFWQSGVYDYDDMREIPVGVEGGDYISREPVEPATTLTGDDLVEYLHRNHPETLPKQLRPRPAAAPSAAAVTETSPHGFTTLGEVSSIGSLAGLFNAAHSDASAIATPPFLPAADSTSKDTARTNTDALRHATEATGPNTEAVRRETLAIAPNTDALKNHKSATDDNTKAIKDLTAAIRLAAKNKTDESSPSEEEDDNSSQQQNGASGSNPQQSSGGILHSLKHSLQHPDQLLALAQRELRPQSLDSRLEDLSGILGSFGRHRRRLAHNDDDDTDSTRPDSAAPGREPGDVLTRDPSGLIFRHPNRPPVPNAQVDGTDGAAQSPSLFNSPFNDLLDACKRFTSTLTVFDFPKDNVQSKLDYNPIEDAQSKVRYKNLLSAPPDPATAGFTDSWTPLLGATPRPPAFPVAPLSDADLSKSIEDSLPPLPTPDPAYSHPGPRNLNDYDVLAKKTFTGTREQIARAQQKWLRDVYKSHGFTSANVMPPGETDLSKGTILSADSPDALGTGVASAFNPSVNLADNPDSNVPGGIDNAFGSDSPAALDQALQDLLPTPTPFQNTGVTTPIPGLNNAAAKPRSPNVQANAQGNAQALSANTSALNQLDADIRKLDATLKNGIQCQCDCAGGSSGKGSSSSNNPLGSLTNSLGGDSGGDSAAAGNSPIESFTNTIQYDGGGSETFGNLIGDSTSGTGGGGLGELVNPSELAQLDNSGAGTAPNLGLDSLFGGGGGDSTGGGFLGGLLGGGDSTGGGLGGLLGGGDSTGEFSAMLSGSFNAGANEGLRSLGLNQSELKRSFGLSQGDLKSFGLTGDQNSGLGDFNPSELDQLDNSGDGTAPNLGSDQLGGLFSGGDSGDGGGGLGGLLGGAAGGFQALKGISGFRKHGSNKELTSGIAGGLQLAAAIDPEPISKTILTVAAMVGNIVSGFMKTPQQIRQEELTRHIDQGQQEARKYNSPSVNIEESTNGLVGQTDAFGNFREVAATPHINIVDRAASYDPLHPKRIEYQPVRLAGQTDLPSDASAPSTNEPYSLTDGAYENPGPRTNANNALTTNAYSDLSVSHHQVDAVSQVFDRLLHSPSETSRDQTASNTLSSNLVLPREFTTSVSSALQDVLKTQNVKPDATNPSNGSSSATTPATAVSSATADHHSAPATSLAKIPHKEGVFSSFFHHLLHDGFNPIEAAAQTVGERNHGALHDIAGVIETITKPLVPFADTGLLGNVLSHAGSHSNPASGLLGNFFSDSSPIRNLNALGDISPAKLVSALGGRRELSAAAFASQQTPPAPAPQINIHLPISAIDSKDLMARSGDFASAISKELFGTHRLVSDIRSVAGGLR